MNAAWAGPRRPSTTISRTSLLRHHLDRVVGGVGRPQLLLGQGEHPGDVHRDVAVADHHRPLDREVELLVAVVGVGVVPADERGGGVAAGQVLAGDAERAVGLAADRVDDRVVEPLEVLDLDVVADLDVAEEAEALAGGGLLVDPDHRLDLRVVGSDAAADQPERGRQPVEEVDLGVRVLVLEDVLSGVEAGRAGADDRDAQRGSPRFLITALLMARRGRIGKRASAADGRLGAATLALPSSASSALRDAHRDAGEDRRLALGVGARLGRAQLLHEVEEHARVVALEGDDELLVVEAEE